MASQNQIRGRRLLDAIIEMQLAEDYKVRKLREEFSASEIRLSKSDSSPKPHSSKY